MEKRRKRSNANKSFVFSLENPSPNISVNNFVFFFFNFSVSTHSTHSSEAGNVIIKCYFSWKDWSDFDNIFSCKIIIVTLCERMRMEQGMKISRFCASEYVSLFFFLSSHNQIKNSTSLRVNIGSMGGKGIILDDKMCECLCWERILYIESL